VVYQCSGWTYDNAYLITFKIEPLHTRAHAHTRARTHTHTRAHAHTHTQTHTHTHAHTHTHTCSIDPAIVGSTGGRLLLESSAVRPSHSLSSMVAKRVPLRPIFRVGNSQKSLGATAGEYGGWVMTGMLFSARNCSRASDVWLGANASSHTSLVVLQFLVEKSIPVITQPSYSPDLAPSDFRLFPTLKMGLKGTRFATMEDIEPDGRTAEVSKRSLHPVLPTMAGSMEQVCVCVRRGPTLKVIR
jgi:hypothetical protein